MQAELYYEREQVGTVDWEQEAGYVAVTVQSRAIDTGAVLRCYAASENRPPFRIGVVEPFGEGLYLRRRISLQALREAGLDADRPHGFFLSESGGIVPLAPPMQTGDALLDALLMLPEVTAARENDGLCIRCPFAKESAFALAPLALLCEVQAELAVLHLPFAEEAEGIDRAGK